MCDVCTCTCVCECVYGCGKPCLGEARAGEEVGGCGCCCLFSQKMNTLSTPPATPLLRACGEVDSNGLNSEEKAESTIGRKIKIIKTNSNCSQRNQFHNFSASLNLLLRPCVPSTEYAPEHAAFRHRCVGMGLSGCEGNCGFVWVGACGLTLVCACLHIHVCVCVCGGHLQAEWPHL